MACGCQAFIATQLFDPSNESGGCPMDCGYALIGCLGTVMNKGEKK